MSPTDQDCTLALAVIANQRPSLKLWIRQHLLRVMDALHESRRRQAALVIERYKDLIAEHIRQRKAPWKKQ